MHAVAAVLLFSKRAPLVLAQLFIVRLCRLLLPARGEPAVPA